MKTSHAVLFCLAALAASAAELPPLNSSPVDTFHPGKFVWADLFTDDLDGATKFYGELFGWKTERIDWPGKSGPHPYVVLSLDGRAVGGITRRPTQLQDRAHGRWVGYLSVRDVEKASASLAVAGGRPLNHIKDRPQLGVRGLFADPDGAVFGLIHSDTGDPGEFRPEQGDFAWAELLARDPAKSASFYRDLAGYEVMPDTRGTDPRKVVLVSGGFSRASIAPRAESSKSHSTWVLFVRVRDVAAATAHAAALGGRVVVASTPGGGSTQSAIIADPQGAHLGLVQLTDVVPEAKP